MFSQTSVLRSSGKGLEDTSCCLQEQYFAQTAVKLNITGANVGFSQVIITPSQNNGRKRVKKMTPGVQPAMLDSHLEWITLLLQQPKDDSHHLHSG